MDSMESPNRIKIAQAGRLIFFSAAFYNIVWTLLFLFAPAWSIRFFGMEAFPVDSSLVRFLGILVGILGLIFALAATRPLIYWQAATFGFLAKMAAFVISWSFYLWGAASLKFALFSFVNDLIWIPGFVWFAYHGLRLEMEPPPSRRIVTDVRTKAVKDQTGMNPFDLSMRKPVLLVFLRHFGCTFCRETLSILAKKKAEMERQGVEPVFVHMGSSEQGQQYLAAYGWANVRHISDPEATFYEAFQLERAKFDQVFGFINWWRGLIAFIKGHGIGLPVGDGFRMPGVFVLKNGRVVEGFRPIYAAEQPDYDTLIACALPQSD